MCNLLLLLALPAQVLTLAQAVESAQAHQPQLRQAHAATDAAEARADEARSPILPQLVGSAVYQRVTGNYAPRPGVIPSTVNNLATGSSLDTFNYFSFGLTLSQYIWDFGQVTGRWRSQQSLAQAQQQQERATGLQVLLSVRTAFFAARAQKTLVQVARENLANQQKHLNQIEGFVRVGTRPAIDAAQARTDTANAKVQLINAENNYESAKAQLNQYMGIEASTDYDVADETFANLPGEDQPTDPLVEEAVRARPEIKGYERQVRAQQLLVSAAKGAYGPSLGASLSLTDAGTDINNLAWNLGATVSASWGLFSGLLTLSQVKEAKANLALVEAQRDLLRQQVRLEVDQARLAVRAAKGAISAAQEALLNARDRLTYAEGRYQAGIGSIIELGDAQVAFTSASAQKVQADYNLASARAQLIKALGRP